MKLYYRKTGSGPAIVILHGLYGSSDNWFSIARELKDRFTVYLPDLRNHGQSPHHEIHTYESMSEDLFEMMSGEGIGKFILAGHSMGGKTAMKYSLRWPDSLNSLVVVDISPFGTNDPENVFYRQHSSILEAIISIDVAISIMLEKYDIVKSYFNGIDFSNWRRLSPTGRPRTRST